MAPPSAPAPPAAAAPSGGSSSSSPQDSAAAVAAPSPTATTVMDAVSFLDTRRRNVRPHTAAELQWWIDAYCRGTVKDYQMAAWLMAVCIHGLTAQETATLTACTVNSGVRLQWDDDDDDATGKSETTSKTSKKRSRLPLVDKHSTGGVGDKISLILAPAVAARGTARVPMMAGRGLGHTGGTIDKLETIPGFRCDCSVAEFQRICRDTGVVIAGAARELCPADKKLYALRDVTATVRSLPLQTASILSKKIAENPDSLVLDVKYGPGSFQPTRQDAQELAASLVRTGEANGLRPTTAFLTRMDEPIGGAVGNWLEVRECLDVMRGHFTPLNRDLVTLCVVQSAQMLYQAERGAESLETYMHRVLASLKDGSALAKFREMTVAQGGDPSVIDHPETYPGTARRTASVCATRDGYISGMNALTVGQISVMLGAGRKVAEDAVDATAGILLKAKVGHAVNVGDEIASLFTSVDDDDGVILATAVERFHGCLKYSSEPVTVPPIISHVVTSANGVQEFVVPELGL